MKCILACAKQAFDCLNSSSLKVRLDSFKILNASLPVRRFNSTCSAACCAMKTKFIKIQSRFRKKKKNLFKMSVLPSQKKFAVIKFYHVLCLGGCSAVQKGDAVTLTQQP